MKIKTFKYIVLYVILVISSIYIWNNFPAFSSYIKNFSSISEIEKIKNNKEIKIGDINKNLIKQIENNLLTGIYLKDKVNLLTINKDFNKAEETILNKNDYNYEDFYNLGNINFLKGYFKFKNNGTGYIENIQKAIGYYNTSLDTIPDYKKKDFIIQNLNLAQDFLSYLYFYDCNKLLLSLLEKNRKILKILYDLPNIFKKQIKAVQKWKKYNEVKQCIISFEQDAYKNIENIKSNIVFFKETENGIIGLIKYYKDDSIMCYKNSPIFKEKYEESLNSSLKYFLDFQDKQEKLLMVFKKAKLDDIKKLCNAKSQIAKNQNKKNKKMNNNFNKLKDLLKPQKPKKNQKPKQGKKNKDNKKNNLNKQEIEKLQQGLKEVDKKAKDILKKIQERKTKKNYNPMEYINRLFNGFYGNKEDYIKGKKTNDIGK